MKKPYPQKRITGFFQTLVVGGWEYNLRRLFKMDNGLKSLETLKTIKDKGGVRKRI